MLKAIRISIVRFLSSITALVSHLRFFPSTSNFETIRIIYVASWESDANRLYYPQKLTWTSLIQSQPGGFLLGLLIHATSTYHSHNLPAFSQVLVILMERARSMHDAGPWDDDAERM